MATEIQRTATDITPDGILQIAAGFMAAKHLFIASEIDLFAQLAGGPATLDDLAARINVPRRTLRISADAMVALNLVERTGDLYGNAPLASTFLSGRGPGTCADSAFLERISYPTWEGLEQAIRTGEAPNRKVAAFRRRTSGSFQKGWERSRRGQPRHWPIATTSAG